MDDREDRPEKDSDDVLVPPLRRRRRPWRRDSGVFWKILIGVVLLAAVGGAWLWLRSGDDGSEAGAPASEAVDRAPSLGSGDEDPAAAAADTAIDLPPLDASDELIRRMAEELSERPRWAQWLVTDDLVRHFVASVAQVASGSSPAPRLQHLAPDEGFRVRESDGAAVIDPASYRRYDLRAATFASLDTEGTARLYRQLHPLFEEAHRELGFPDDSFDDAVARAVGTLLAVEVPEGPVEVEEEEGVYVFRDPALESMSPAQKQLLRMGPDNARRVQAKLRELTDAIGIEPTRPGGETDGG